MSPLYGMETVGNVHQFMGMQDLKEHCTHFLVFTYKLHTHTY